jgi:hypothetical protein
MEGVGDYTLAPATDPSLCLEWDGGPGLVQIADPTSTTTEPYKPETGSMVPKFANTFTAASGRPLVVVRAAVGGTSLLSANANSNGYWDVGGTLFGDSVTRLTDALADIVALGHTIGYVHVVWSQGHSDANGGNDLHLYEAATAALVSRWRTAMSIPALKVYMELLSSTDSASSTPPAQPDWQTVRDAQQAACDATDGLEMAFTEGTEYWERHWLRFDNLHYSQAGYNYMGQRFAEFMAVDLGLTPPAPSVEGAPTSNIGRYLISADLVLGEPTYIAPGTYSLRVPYGATSMDVEAEGSAGGAGSCSNLATGNAGGGGGGAYASSTAVAVTPGETLTVEIAAAGLGATSSTSTPGGNGGPCGVKRGSTWLVKADGGLGGAGQGGASAVAGGAGGLVANSVGAVKTAGTAGANGGGSGTGGGGAGAAPLGGTGGAARTTAGAGNDGTIYGGGGGGGRAGNADGGDGADGVVIVSWNGVP